MADIHGNENVGSGGDLDALNFGMPSAPGYQDRDAQMADIRETRANTPDEDYARIHAEVFSTVTPVEAQKLMGEGPGAVPALDDQRIVDQLKNVDPTKSVQEAIVQATDLASDQARREAAAQHADQQSGSSGSSAASSNAPQKPMDLEKTLASIQLSTARDKRFVVMGDPKIETAFFAELEARGKLHYQGGSPIITVSRSDAAKILKQVTDREGVNMVPALKIEFDRTGHGLLGTAAANVKNLLGRQNSVEVFVVGDKVTTDKKLEDIGKLLQKLDENKFIGYADKNQFPDGKLNLENGKPVEITATRSLQELVALARNTVGEYSRDQTTKDDARKDFRNQQQDEAMAKASGKSIADGGSTSAAAGAEAKKPEPSKYVSDLQSDIQTAVMTPGGLSKKDGNQVVAEQLMHGVRNLKDSELANLPTAVRQEMLTNVAVVIGKADTGAFKGFSSEKLDKAREADPARDKAAAPSIREKVSELISAEKARDPEFESKALQQLSNMANSGVATREQAESAAETLAPGRTLPPPSVEVFKDDQAGKDKAKTESTEAPSTEATAQRSAESAKDAGIDQPKQSDATRTPTSELEPQSTAKESSEASRPASDAIPSQSQGQTSFEFSESSRTPSTGTAESTVTAPREDSTTKSSDASSAETRTAPEANSAGKAEASVPAANLESAPTVAKEAAAPASPTSEPSQATSTTTSTEASAPIAEKVTRLVEKIDAIVKAGPDSLTREDASALLASLDGRQTAKLASLDGRSGTAPTETLVKIEGILNEVSKGRHGDDLAAAATGLGEALSKWKSQDVDRVMTGYNVSHADIAAKASEIRSADSAWHTPGNNAKVASAEQPGLNPESNRTSSTTAPAISAQDSAKQEAAVRYTETEMAAGKLANLMSNPAQNFTNRDKSWNERNVEAAADSLLRIDVESTKQMSQNQRDQVAQYAAFIADNANSGRLPGFEGAEGKARAEALTERARDLIGGASGSASPAVTANITKADRMMTAMAQRSRGLSRSGAGTRAQGAGSTAAVVKVDRAGSSPGRKIDASQLGKEIGNAMFKAQTVSEANAKFMMKNSDVLSADSMKSLSPQEKAQAAVGLARLAEEVRGGFLGEFKTLTPAVQKMVVGAEQTANRLQTELSGDKAVAAELGKAHRELNGSNAAEAKAPSNAAPAKGLEQSMEKQPGGSTGGRGMER